MTSEWENDQEGVERVVLGKLRREVHADPLPDNQGLRLCWRLRGRQGVAELVILTGWRNSGINAAARMLAAHGPIAASYGVHLAVEPGNKSGIVYEETCSVLGGGKCWHRDTSLATASEMLGEFVSSGSEALWARLEEEYSKVVMQHLC